MPSTRRILTLLALMGALQSGGALADGSGFRASAGDDPWPRWHSRVLSAPSFSLWPYAVSAQAGGSGNRESISLLGDFYFSRSLRRDRVADGFRATSGVIIGPLGSRVLSAFGSDASRGLGFGASIARAGQFDTRSASGPLDTTPYLGVGYSSGSVVAGWGFSADIGVVARSDAAAGKFGRGLNGSQAVDELLREMRLSPMLNIGVSYSF